MKSFSDFVQFAKANPGKTIGALSGALLGILVLTIGLLKTIFVVIFIILGLVIGNLVDSNFDIKNLFHSRKRPDDPFSDE